MQLFSALLLSSPAAAVAQHAPAPAAYSLVETIGQFGPPSTMKIFRDGSLAVMETKVAEHLTRFYFELSTGRTFSWDTTVAEPTCSAGTFTGDWGDPFSGELAKELEKVHPKEVGKELVNGIKTKLLEADNPQAGGPKMRIWFDVDYGMIVKWVVPEADGKPRTMLEVKSLKVSKPPAAIFVLPPECAKLAAQPPPPPPPTEAEQIAAATGAPPGKYARGTSGPGSKEPCSVVLSVVQPKTLAPIETPFRIAVDPALDVEHPPHYVMGEADKPFFQGGGLHEVTGQLKGGAVRLDGLSPAFDVEIVYGTAADGAVSYAYGSSAYIYKQCYGKSSSNLLLVIDPTKASAPPEWLWEK